MSDYVPTPSRLLFAVLLTVIVALPAASLRAQTPGIRIAWDYRTIIRAANRAGDYARLERVGDSTLVLAYGYGGVKRSHDNGKTWGPRIAGVQDTFPHAHPYNVELKFLDNGTLLLPYNYRAYGKDGVPIAIRVNASTDGGKTWTQRAVVATAGDTPGNGIYEPSIVQLPSGELQLFAANEAPYPGPAQEITMYRSFDHGYTWSDGETVSTNPPGRDGMPVSLLLKKNKGIVFSIEDNGWPDGCGAKFRPSVIHSPSVENSWSNAPIKRGSKFVPVYRDRALAPEAQLNCAQSGPAPYVEQFPQGETILSFQSNIAPFAPRDEIKQTMVVAIGNDEARNFTNKSYPFGNPKRLPGDNDPDNCGNGVCGVAAIWNSLFVKDSMTVTAVTSTGAGFRGQRPNGTYLMDGHRITEPVAYKAPSGITVDGKLDEPVWKSAHSTFIGARSPMHGSFRPAWDDENLYLACTVSDPSIWVQDGNLENSDGCIFDFSPRAGGLFRVVVGATGDVALKRQRIREYETWDADLEVAADTAGGLGQTNKAPEQFSVEVAIPWSEIGGKPIPGRGMGINYGMSRRYSIGREFDREFVSGNDPDRSATWQKLTLGASQVATESVAGGGLSTEMQLANYPNPFRQQTTVTYRLPEASRVALSVYDVLGRKVKTVVQGQRSAGRHEAALAAGPLPSGVYVMRLTASSGAAKTRTVTLLR